MRIQDAFIAIVLVSLVLTGVSIYLGDLSDKHGQEADWGNLNRTRTSIETQSKEMEKIYNNTINTNIEEGAGGLEVPYKMIVASITGIGQVAKSWTILGNLITDISSFMGVPLWVTSVLGGLIIVSLIAMILFAFLKWKVET